jgi:hypothetical protein
MQRVLFTSGLVLLAAVACTGRVVLGDGPTGDAGMPGEDAGSGDASSVDDTRDASGTSDRDDASEGDAGAFDAVSPDAGCIECGDAASLPCSLVGGTWNVAYDTVDGTDASFQFVSAGTFIGGPRSAALPAGAIYSGQWGTEGDGGVAVWNTEGLGCTSSVVTHLAVVYTADCNTVTWTDEQDNCTGSRMYFNADIFQRQ